MAGTGRSFILLVVAAGLCAVGAIDAGIGDQWDLALLFGVVGLLTLAVLVLHHPHRRQVELRADLVRWLRGRSDVSGESVETIADRAVAAYRAELTEDP